MKEKLREINQKATDFSHQSWRIPACFFATCLLTVMGIVQLMTRGFTKLEPGWLFSIGADIFCMSICVMLCLSAMLNLKGRNEQTYVFVTLLTVNAMALYLDETSWLVQGLAIFRSINLFINVLYYINGAVVIYLFWQYIRRALQMKGALLKIANFTLTFLLFVSIVLNILNIFVPIYFSVDANGVYKRSDTWIFSQIYLIISLVCVIIGLILSKAPIKDRLVAASFAAIPMLNFLLTGYTFGISTQYAATLVSIVLIYGVLFAEREKTIASTELELNVATRIQADMLPSTFPFLPENTEFDLFATMNPAKEVGGDFYDFFMVDENHLAMVIADVSGKGIPAALFMMASKILIKNCVMTGISPHEALETVNKQICENNQEQMFVTVWLGVMDLTDGTLRCANAGHEYPLLLTPGGDFELIKNKHNFVVGGIKSTKYNEYELRMQPGSKLFLYTDGVPEAEDSKENQYGYDRFVEVLNKHKQSTPRELVEAVKADVEVFVNNNPQFDDLTALCIHYTGKKQRGETQ